MAKKPLCAHPARLLSHTVRAKALGVPFLPSFFTRRWRLLLALISVMAIALCWKTWRDTMGDPIVQRATVALGGIPAGTPALKAAVLADIHVAGPDMPPKRLARIVAQVNALKPDIVLIAGDLVSEKRVATRTYSAAEVVAPLALLDAPLGVWFTPGNHDHWFDLPGLTRELDKAGIRTMQNEAAQIGPLVVGFVDDAFTRRDDLPETLRQMDALQGGRLILTHSPDIFPHVPIDVPLVLAGHTHCGQIAYPWGGSPATMSRYGDRFACGVNMENGRTVITGAGLGTSLLPLRFNTRPEIWLVELR